MKNILVTDDLGYIGADTCVELLSGGFQVVIAAKQANSHLMTLSAIKKITGKKYFPEANQLQGFDFLEVALKKYEYDLSSFNQEGASA